MRATINLEFNDQELQQFAERWANKTIVTALDHVLRGVGPSVVGAVQNAVLQAVGRQVAGVSDPPAPSPSTSPAARRYIPWFGDLVRDDDGYVGTIEESAFGHEGNSARIKVKSPDGGPDVVRDAKLPFTLITPGDPRAGTVWPEPPTPESTSAPV